MKKKDIPLKSGHPEWVDRPIHLNNIEMDHPVRAVRAFFNHYPLIVAKEYMTELLIYSLRSTGQPEERYRLYQQTIRLIEIMYVISTRYNRTPFKSVGCRDSGLKVVFSSLGK